MSVTNSLVGVREIYFWFCFQGEACIMGAKRIYRKRKSEKKCMQVKYAGAMTSEPCVCTDADFDW